MFRHLAEAARVAAPAAKEVADEAAKAGVKAVTEQLTKAVPSAAATTVPSSARDAVVRKEGMGLEALRSLLAPGPVAQPAGRPMVTPETAREAAHADGAQAAMDLDASARMPIQPPAAGTVAQPVERSVSRPTTASGVAQGDGAAMDLDALAMLLTPIQPPAAGTGAQPAGSHSSEFMRRLASADVGTAPSNDHVFPPLRPAGSHSSEFMRRLASADVGTAPSNDHVFPPLRPRHPAPGSGRAAWWDSREASPRPSRLPQMIEPMGEPWGARVGAKIGASGYPEGTETLGVAALVAALRSAGEASPSLSTLSEEQRQAASDALHDKHTALRRLRDQLKTIRSPVIALTKAIDSKRKESQWKLLVRQLEWENMATEDAVKKYKEMSLDVSERTEGSMLPASRKIISSFYEPLVEAMKEEIGKVRAGVFGIDRRATGTYLQLVRPEHLAVLTLHTTMSLLLRGDRMHGNEDTSLPEAGRVRVIKLVLALGEMIEAQCSVVGAEQCVRQHKQMEKLSKRVVDGETANAEGAQGEDGEQEECFLQWDDAQLRSMAEKSQKRVDLMVRRNRARVERDLLKMEQAEDCTESARLATQLLRRVKMQSSPWRRAAAVLSQRDMGLEMRAKLGSTALKVLLKTATVPQRNQVTGLRENVPAFLHTHAFNRTGKHKTRYGVVEWHPELRQQMQDGETAVQDMLHPRYMPMLVKPRPWRRFNDGGYLTLSSMVMRGVYSRQGPSAQQLDELRKWESGIFVQGDGMTRLYQALNILGEQGWKINKSVLQTMTTLWEQGGGIVGLPSRTPLSPPKPPQPFFHVYHDRGAMVVGPAVPVEDMRQYRREMKRIKRNNAELHSQCCDFQYKLQVGKMLQDEAAFYYPHNVDFRGRAYTMHPYLNHLGSDASRGCLLFAESRPLGENGLYWLKVHLGNKWGSSVDKLPMDERAQFTDSILEDILDSAENPIGGRRRWMEAEDPFQFLAAAIELKQALAHPDPRQYQSSVPVHMDGSCNGLQHYAALARDLHGGTAVNLVPADRPQDVYTGIADTLRKRVESDSLGGAESAQDVEYATALLPHVDRKLVKQTVMTSVYGVTFIGARQQIQNRLKERDLFDEDFRYKVSCYAARETLKSLDSMFSNAREVMTWLGEAASLVAELGDNGRGESVRWRTPLGLPVVQPYRKRGRKIVRTLLQNFIVEYDNPMLPVIKQKQRSAFPPNFIHSVDSAHMMLTAIACNKAGLSFAGVHDSYWTHAGTVPEMNRLLREAFVELHSEPLLERLAEGLEYDFPEVKGQLPPTPSKGSLDLNVVLDSTYFFS